MATRLCKLAAGAPGDGLDTLPKRRPRTLYPTGLSATIPDVEFVSIREGR
jgi:hypothetical protein